MLRRRLAAAVVLTMCAATAPAAHQLQDDAAVPRGRLDPRIAVADRQRYKSIQDAKNWRNPILVIRADGNQVISKGLPSGERTVAPTDLQRALIDLPVTAWPYGRVVAVQDIGLHPADLSDGPAIANNRNVTLAILKTLEVTVEGWPSA